MMGFYGFQTAFMKAIEFDSSLGRGEGLNGLTQLGSRTCNYFID